MIVYLSGRPFWMDEGSLWGNLAGKPIFDFSEPLTGDQLAPLGFLIAQRAVMSILGVIEIRSAAPPAGMLDWFRVFLFARLARAVLARRPGTDRAGPVLRFRTT